MLLIILKFLGLFMLGSLICSMLLIITGQARKISRYERMARHVYIAGFWRAEGVSAYDAGILWTQFRDTFDIPPGTATAHQVGDPWPAAEKRWGAGRSS